MAFIAEVNEFKERVLIPVGKHLLTLKEIKAVRVTSKFPDGLVDDSKTAKVVWLFNSNQKYKDDKTGKDEFYEYAAFTNTKYGGKNSTMTKLVNQMVPDATVDNIKGFDYDELLETKYEAMFRHTKADNGKTYAELLYITPYVRRVQPVVDEEGDDEPVVAVAPKPKAKRNSNKPVSPPVDDLDE